MRPGSDVCPKIAVANSHKRKAALWSKLLAEARRRNLDGLLAILSKWESYLLHGGDVFPKQLHEESPHRPQRRPASSVLGLALSCWQVCSQTGHNCPSAAVLNQKPPRSRFHARSDPESERRNCV